MNYSLKMARLDYFTCKPNIISYFTLNFGVCVRFPTKKLHKLSGRNLVVFVVVAARAEVRGRKRKISGAVRFSAGDFSFLNIRSGRDVRASAQEHFVGLDLRARHLGELFEQVLLRELLFLLTLDIEDDVALVHHDEAVAVNDGVLHVVGDHHGGELVFAHDAVRQLEHLGRRRGVERRGVLVEQQQLRLL